jgi:aminoglycoside 2'-N-acetyltransferase I
VVNGLRVLAFPEAAVPPILKAQVAALQEDAWPSSAVTPPGPIHDAALEPRSMLLVRDGTVLAALDILSKAITHRGRSYLARGLSTVVTAQKHRRRGHGRALVTAAHDAIAVSGADLAIFTCDWPLRGFYESAGWHWLAGTVLLGGTPAKPLPSDVLGKVAMGDFFPARAKEAAGDFAGARIDLYPGTIDKLW